MKLMIASDLHGSALFVKKLMERMEAEQPDKLLLLGDLLYHGPRNALPEEYSCPSVMDQLNAVKDKIVAVRGNCDSEVDQMVLEFPIMADYALLPLDGGRTAFVTHGHLFNIDNPPPHQPGDVLIHGHTHVHCAIPQGDYTYINPGSAALPKENNPRTYAIYENRTFVIKDFTGKTVIEKKF